VTKWHGLLVAQGCSSCVVLFDLAIDAQPGRSIIFARAPSQYFSPTHYHLTVLHAQTAVLHSRTNNALVSNSLYAEFYYAILMQSLPPSQAQLSDLLLAPALAPCCDALFVRCLRGDIERHCDREAFFPA
jgi:hypothetical protein